MYLFTRERLKRLHFSWLLPPFVLHPSLVPSLPASHVLIRPYIHSAEYLKAQAAASLLISFHLQDLAISTSTTGHHGVFGRSLTHASAQASSLLDILYKPVAGYPSTCCCIAVAVVVVDGAVHPHSTFIATVPLIASSSTPHLPKLHNFG